VLHKRLWPAALLSFAGIFIYVILFSHRIAGPSTGSMLSCTRSSTTGSPVVKFRDGDYFQPTAALLKELSEKMRSSRRIPASGPGAIPVRRRDMNRFRRPLLRLAPPIHAWGYKGRRGFTLIEITIVLC